MGIIDLYLAGANEGGYCVTAQTASAAVGAAVAGGRLPLTVVLTSVSALPAPELYCPPPAEELPVVPLLTIVARFKTRPGYTARWQTSPSEGRITPAPTVKP